MAKADIKAGRAYVELLLKQSAFEKGLRSAQKRLQAFGGEMQSFGRSIAMAGAGMLLPLGLSVKTFASFDDAMRAVKGVTQATTAEFEKLSKKAKDLGASTSFTAVEVASLMTELGRAGFNPDQIEKMTGAVLDLARATGTDATVSSGIMAASIRQFGLEATDAIRVADGLTAAANKSFNTVESLGEALSYAGPVAADFGMDIESTLAVLGALGNVGIQGSNAGTAIRRLLTLTGAEAGKMKEIFGVEFLDAAGNVRPLIDTLGEVTEATKNLGTGDRAKKFNDAFGLLGITGASAIGKAAVSAKELEAAIRDAGGTAAKTAKEMDSGIGGAFRIMLSAVEGVAIAIGEVLSESITTATRALTSIATAAIEFIKANATLIKIVAAVAAGLVAIGAAFFTVGLAASAAGVAISGILSIVAMVKLAIAAVVSAFLFLLSPLGLIVAGLTASVAAWLMFTQSGKAAIESVAAGLSWLRGVFSETFSGISDAIAAGNMALAGEIAITALKVVLLKGLEAISSLFGDAFGKIGAQLIDGDFSSAWETAITNMAAIWDGFVEGIVAVFTNAARAITDTWQKTTTALADFILEDAANGGVLGRAAMIGSGVDVEAESARGGKLDKDRRDALKKRRGELEGMLVKADASGGVTADKDGTDVTSEDLRRMIADTNEALGINVKSFLESAKADAAADLGSSADAVRSKLDQMDRDAQERTMESSAAASAANEGGASTALTEEEKKLAELRAKAAAAVTKADEEAAKKAASQAGTPTPGSGMSSPALAGRVLGSFSAGALLAGAGGGSAADRTAKASEIIAKEAPIQSKRLEKIEKFLESGGAITA